MALTIEDLLSYTKLTDTVKLTTSGVPNPLPPAFFSTKESVPGDRAQYIQLYGSRRIASRVPYGAPPKVAQKQSLSQATVRLMQFSNQMVFDGELQQILRNFDSYDPENPRAVQLLQYQGDEFRVTMDNTRITSLGLFLANGKNWFDSNNMLLNTSSGAVETVDQGIPTTNFGNVTDSNSPGGYVFASSWQLPETDIVSQMKALRALAAKLSGQMPVMALHGANIPGYISQNSSSRSYYPFQSNNVDAMLKQNKVPDMFCDIEWVDCQNMFYEANAGTQYNVFPADTVVFCPKISKENYTLFEGSMFVPPIFGVGPDALSVWRGAKEVTGMGRYAYMPNPLEIVDVMFDTFLPRFKNPRAFFPAKVTN